MQEYVLGFAFTPQNERGEFKVALIEKLKPDWQKGKLNGIGGKVEPHETAHMAMVREFKEETGVYVPGRSWDYIGKMRGDDSWCVYVYTTTHPDIINVKTVEQERVVLLDPIKDIAHIYQKGISNVPWLIYSCLDADYTNTRCSMVVEYGD